MQRTEEFLVEPKHEESTKYFVNDIECKKDAIYQTILDNEFFADVKIDKKYHHEFHESKVVKTHEEEYFEEGFHSSDNAITSTKNETENRNANFCLRIEKFTAKVNPTSETFKLLIDKMIHAVDTTFDAFHDYEKHAKDYHNAVKNCMSFYFDNVINSHGPYENIFFGFLAEYFANVMDTLPLYLTAAEKMPGQNLEQPSMKYDMSSIKEEWDDKWLDSKKSNYIQNFLDVILKQVDGFKECWSNHPVFANSKSQVEAKFDDFKDVINAFQQQRREADIALNKKLEVVGISVFKPGQLANADTAANDHVETIRPQQ